MTPNELTKLCDTIQAAEREAAALMLHARGILAETKTDRRNVVTDYDRRVQALLMERLRAAVPDARFYCEEQEVHDDLHAAQLFIIDPIDGTMNFVRGFHQSCISVAYAEHGELCAAAVYNPYVDEMFSAVRAKGAFLNGRAIRVTEEDLENSLVCFGTAPYNAELADESFAMARLLFDHSLDIRREGSAELDLCSVAAGRAGLYFELRLSLWDYAAGWLILREAGGEAMQPDGSPLPFDGSRPPVVAGTARTLADFLRVTGRG